VPEIRARIPVDQAGTLLAVAPAMRPLRTLVALTGLLALALAACAPSVPWPPKSGSCIEAFRRGRYKKARWQYWIEGREVRYAEVERLVYDTPELREKVRRHERVDLAAVVLIPSGGVTWIGGAWSFAASHRLGLLALPALGAAAIITGIVLSTTNEDPFRRAVNAYNASHEGLCRRAPEAAPPREPWVPPPETLPTLPTQGWVP
jgi:hypothetical protein